jgi:cellulose synthase/poly-beta-1,6-N-acetylglucosamine synthase-like glycosyltransferase
LGQTYSPAEVIVIDDGSADSSPDIVSAISVERPNVIFWPHRNRGAHNTINAAIHRADADLIAILNSDDRYAPRRLERIAQRFEEDPSIDLVSTGLRFMDGNGQPIDNPWFDDALGFYRETANLGAALINGNFLMTTSNIVARRTLFERVGLFSDFRYTHDLDFFLRVLGRGLKIEFLDEPLVWYRFHQTNTISEGTLKVKIEWAASIALYLNQLAHEDPARLSSDILLISQIMRKHSLSELVSLFLAKLPGLPPGRRTLGDFKRDAAFWAAVEAVAA